ncbi:hypothetical protein JCM8547_008265 [Rhodosporidiobolus lusitaniae]
MPPSLPIELQLWIVYLAVPLPPPWSPPSSPSRIEIGRTLSLVHRTWTHEAQKEMLSAVDVPSSDDSPPDLKFGEVRQQLDAKGVLPHTMRMIASAKGTNGLNERLAVIRTAKTFVNSALKDAKFLLFSPTQLTHLSLKSSSNTQSLEPLPHLVVLVLGSVRFHHSGPVVPTFLSAFPSLRILVWQGPLSLPPLIFRSAPSTLRLLAIGYPASSTKEMFAIARNLPACFDVLVLRDSDTLLPP